MKIMNEKLKNDHEISKDHLFYYELNGKKIVLLEKKWFLYLFCILEKDDFFEKIVEILQDNPNAEEIYNIVYIYIFIFIYIYLFSYIYKDFFEEKSNIIKNTLIQYNLDDKEIKNLNDLIEIVQTLLANISNYITNEGNEEEFNDLIEEITMTFSLKSGVVDIIKSIKQNGIIQEIFKLNYHSQIINKSTKIVKLLLLKNELT